jgi:hypothetical protein
MFTALHAGRRGWLAMACALGVLTASGRTWTRGRTKSC